MNLELFHRWKCPYSAKVREHIQELHLEHQVQLKEIGEDATARNELQHLTGHAQVPCLVIDGQPMLESEKINHWLDENIPH